MCTMNIKLRPLSLSDRNLIISYFKKYPPIISDHTFTNMFVWRHARPIWFTELRDTLVFLISGSDRTDGKLLFGPPVGKTDPLTIINELRDEISGAVRLPEKTAMRLKDSGKPVAQDRDNADYVYLVSDLAQLPGRKYTKKRNHIHQCLKQFTCEYEPLSADNLQEAAAMQERWCMNRECGKNQGLCRELRAIKEAFCYFQEFALSGGAIRVNGEIKAYVIGEALSENTAVCHFEKAMPDVHGLNQLINHWFAKYSLSEYTFINREQDLGIKGLRQAKESYYPHHLEMKYSAFTNRESRPDLLKKEICTA